MIISLIVAATENGVIGRDGAMPWSMPSDLKHFRSVTLGKPVIMGRKTYQSIGKPLPGRHNIVVTKSPDFCVDGVELASSLDSALKSAACVAGKTGAQEIMIIGGGQIYKAALPIADRIYLTRIKAVLAGDATFPVIDPDIWRTVSMTALPRATDDAYAAEVLVLERKSTLV
jgi:dihydrofolate reductase